MTDPAPCPDGFCAPPDRFALARAMLLLVAALAGAALIPAVGDAASLVLG